MSDDSIKKLSDDALKKLSKDLVDVPFNENDDSEESGLNKKENETDLKVFSSLILTEQDVRKLLELEIYFSKVTKNIQKKIQILNISSTFVHMYSLQTFVEKRQKYWQFKRYICGRIDDYTNGQIEDVWNVKLKDKIKPFEDKCQDVIVKHSENIQPCFNCSNQPMIVNCAYCGGNKWLVYYQVIKITHHNYLDEYVTEPHLIPLNKIKHASPDMLYKIEKEEVTPFKFNENKEITNASEKFIKLHKKNSKKERILLQRHQIKKIKICTVEYLYKNKFKRVFIYGNDKSSEIHVPYKASNSSFVNSLLCCLFV